MKKEDEMGLVDGKEIVTAKETVSGLFYDLFQNIAYCSAFVYTSIFRINKYFAAGTAKAINRKLAFQPELVFLKDFIAIWSSLRLYELVTKTPKSQEYNIMASSSLEMLAEILEELLKNPPSKTSTAHFKETVMSLFYAGPHRYETVFKRIGIINPALLAECLFELRVEGLLGVCLDETITGPVLDRGKIRLYYESRVALPRVQSAVASKLVFLDDFRSYNQSMV